MVDESEVTASEIARLAGVGRAAVSNWRKRFTDFPQPIGGTDTSPRFRSAEILSWLEDQGKLGTESARELVWQRLATSGSDPVVDRVAAAGEYLAGRHPTTTLDKRTRDALDALAADGGAEPAFDELCGRFVASNWRTMAVTPPDLAQLMTDLVAPLAGSVFDPACGLGTLLRAAARTKAGIEVAGQEVDPSLARLATAGLAFGGAESTIETGDSLRADAFPDLRADAVVCNPPFNDRNWGAEELAYDQRWAFGLPPKGESELAWVQHCLAHLRPGGRTVVLMPPAAASRRSGRPIRAELLRRGAVRAIVQLPAGAAPPLGLSLQLWVLEQPAEQAPDARVLFVDGTAGMPQRIDDIGWRALRERVDPVWTSFLAAPSAVAEEPGRHTVRPVIDLLDDEVDLAPARYLRAATELDVAALRTTQRSFAKLLDDLAELLPDVQPTHMDTGPKATVSIAELQRSGAVSVRQQAGRLDVQAGGDGLPVYTARDVISGEPPSGRIPAGTEHVAVLPGDVLVPTVLTSAVALVVTEPGAALGPHVQLLRPDPDQIDSWFLAGFLRSRDSLRFASTMSGTHRIDVRRVEVPRVPLAEQRKYAAAFELLARFDATLSRASNLGHDLTRSLNDGLAAGTLAPTGQPDRKPAT